MSVPLDRVLGLLDEIKQVAQTASMTGSLDGGARMLIAVYNKCLAAVADEAAVGDLFPKLDAEAGMDEVGVAAALLAGYIRPRPNVPTRPVHVRVGDAQD